MFGHDYWGIDYFDNNYWGDAVVSSSGGSEGKLVTTGKITVITVID